MAAYRSLRTTAAAIALVAVALVVAGCSAEKTVQAPAAPGAARPAAPAQGGSPSPPGAILAARANYDFSVEVDRAYPADARLFQCDARGKFLADLPSKGKSWLVDLSARRATAVLPATIVREEESGLVRFAEPDPAAAPTSALAIDGA